MEGRKLNTIQLSNTKDQFTFDLSGMEPGIYFATLITKEEIVETVKFTIGK